ncbi:Fe2-S2-type ferredoxin [Candidatus Nitrosoglobus terrae]|uniref:Fe2-S2-type ferredoxin n=1 Tax=Candidatus Nitrosoglobus terrae TaxID=1630141 RepID=A0A1Q2SK52_9GAMM|nr:2Fe-2S ferredoxin [Candidatus Nitrosoglobus terrae]BAW79492.1 Fe2-S2-type ferredoxin [Candidatus Nitrosoglobus terrae]
MNESYYRYHVFFCTNQRDNGRPCCQDHNSSAFRSYAKEKIKALGLAKNHQVRINIAGCLNRCAQGPAIVVYPEGIWYSYTNHKDIDEIISEHLINGRPVVRLRI